MQLNYSEEVQRQGELSKYVKKLVNLLNTKSEFLNQLLSYTKDQIQLLSILNGPNSHKKRQTEIEEKESFYLALRKKQQDMLKTLNGLIPNTPPMNTLASKKNLKRLQELNKSIQNTFQDLSDIEQVQSSFPLMADWNEKRGSLKRKRSSQDDMVPNKLPKSSLKVQEKPLIETPQDESFVVDPNELEPITEIEHNQMQEQLNELIISMTNSSRIIRDEEILSRWFGASNRLSASDFSPQSSNAILSDESTNYGRGQSI